MAQRPRQAAGQALKAGDGPTLEVMSRLTAVPALRSNAKKLKLVQRLVFAGVLAGFLCGPVALIIAVRSNKPVPVVQIPERALVQLEHETFAQQVAEDYLSGNGTKLPFAYGVDPTFETKNGNGSLEHSPLHLRKVELGSYKKGKQTFQEYTFSFAFRSVRPAQDTARTTTPRDAQIDAYILNVVVRLAPVGQTGAVVPMIGAIPTLRPDITGDVAGQIGEASKPSAVIPSEELPGNVQPKAGTAIQNAVTAWAQAYATDDRARLKELVNPGSNDDGNEYRGLGGFTVDGSVAILYLAKREEENLWVAQVKIPLLRSGTSFRSATVMDVLVLDADPSQVFSWGAPGSGPSLKKYGTSLR